MSIHERTTYVRRSRCECDVIKQKIKKHHMLHNIGLAFIGVESDILSFLLPPKTHMRISVMYLKFPNEAHNYVESTR
jgi:hypothetical protein